MRARRLFVSVFVLFGLLGVPAPVSADDDPPSAPPDAPAVDEREAAGAGAEPAAAQVAAAEALGADVRWNGQTAVPRTVTRHDGGALTAPSGDDPETIARRFLADHAAVWGFSEADLGALRLRRVAAAPEHLTTRVWFQQVTPDGREVFGAVLGVVLDGQGRVILAGGPVVPGLDADTGPTRLDEEAAADATAESVGDDPEGDLEPAPSPEPGVAAYENEYAEDVADPEPVLVEELVFPVAGEPEGRPAYRTNVMVDGGGWYDAVVDADTGEILYRDSVWEESGPEGTVFREQHPEVAGASRQLTPFSGIDGSWVADRTTAGNNAVACHDPNGDDSCDYQPQTPASGDAGYQHFSYGWTDAIRTSGGTDWTTDRDAVITQAFYYVNMLHDLWYGYGFTEAERNFQQDNFGRGGAGNDRVNVFVDWGATADPQSCCNARMGTPADGSSPRLELRLGLRPDNEDMHRAMNGDTVTHEFGHGVSNRMVGDGTMGSGTQTDGLGEGWSDAMAFAVWGDPSYGEYNTTGNTTIRRVVYDTSTLTYGDLCNPGCQEHNDGEIWATALWDVRAALVARYGEGDGADRFRRLLIQGMANTPGTPDFLDARDGLLAAEQTVYGGADRCAVWSAFAVNGMGSDASSSSQSSVTEGFATPAECSPTADAGGPYTVAEGSTVSLDATASSNPTDASAGPISSYAWDFDADGDHDDATGATPTFGPRGDNGSQTVSVLVTTTSGTTDTDTATVTIGNVAPGISVANPPTATPEGGSVAFTAEFSDPGWLDTYTATIDWGTGAGPEPATPVVTTQGNPGPDVGTVGGSHDYGDNGEFTVTITITDDDGDTGQTSFVATVDNVDPTATMDTVGAVGIDGGVPVFLNEAGQPVTLKARSSDPGSDDLTFRWSWGDGTADTVATSLVNPPGADGVPSPSVQPRAGIEDEQAHTYAEACLYTVAATVTDDDGGASPPALARVVSMGNADRNQGTGWWYNEYKGGSARTLTEARLDCYLEITGILSSVFSEVRAAATIAQASAVLEGTGSAKTARLDRALLTAWLNLANGGVDYDELVDTDGNGTLDSVYSDVLATAEAVRLDPGLTTGQANAQKDILERINQRDG